MKSLNVQEILQYVGSGFRVFKTLYLKHNVPQHSDKEEKVQRLITVETKWILSLQTLISNGINAALVDPLHTDKYQTMSGLPVVPIQLANLEPTADNSRAANYWEMKEMWKIPACS